LSRLLFATGLFWLLLIVAVRWGERQRPWPLELLDTFGLYAFAPFLALGPLALALRSRLLLGLCAAAGVLFGQQFGHLFLPAPVQAASSGPSLRILTYNVLGNRNDARALAELARVEQPDVIVIQELPLEYAQDLTRRLGTVYPYRELTELDESNDGGGTFSRLPILEAEMVRPLPSSNLFQRLRLGLGERSIRLINVHTKAPRLRTRNPPGPIPPIVRGFGSAEREQELEWLIAETARLDGPYILAGDFNIAADSRPYRHFPDRWHDAFREAGWGFGHTFPTHYALWRGRLAVSIPLVRIDYILTSPELTARRAWVPQVEGSDHLPVIAELELR
jgi:endonuclease/exonuclease/phosphatase (EEP) superfamily protein YafD